MGHTTVWKFPLTGRITTLLLPEGAEPLTACYQQRQCVLWVLLDPARPPGAAR